MVQTTSVRYHKWKLYYLFNFFSPVSILELLLYTDSLFFLSFVSRFRGESGDVRISPTIKKIIKRNIDIASQLFWWALSHCDHNWSVEKSKKRNSVCVKTSSIWWFNKTRPVWLWLDWSLPAAFSSAWINQRNKSDLSSCQKKNQQRKGKTICSCVWKNSLIFRFLRVVWRKNPWKKTLDDSCVWRGEARNLHDSADDDDDRKCQSKLNRTEHEKIFSFSSHSLSLCVSLAAKPNYSDEEFSSAFLVSLCCVSSSSPFCALVSCDIECENWGFEF